MKKWTTRIAALLIALVMVMTMVGCGKKKGDPYGTDGVTDSENTLDIVTIDKGYGTKWIEALAEGFKKKYPDVTITITKEIEDTNITNKLDMGAEHSRYDLFFGGTDMRGSIVSILNGDTKKSLLANITDVYEAAPDGTKIKDTIDESLLASFRHELDGEDVYYTMPWVQTVAGMLVNEKVMIENFGKNWEETHPIRTTDELLDVCAELAAKGVSAFVHSADTKYYQFLYEVWWAQYEGLDNVTNFYAGRYYDEFEQKYKVGPEIFNQKGRLEAVKVMEDIFSNGYSDSRSNGWSWNETQTYFMLGESAFFANGDWNNLEMEKSFPDASVKFLRTPIVSSLGTKLGITEKQLLEVIDYVDGLLEGNEVSKPSFTPSGEYTLDQVIEEVSNARKITYTYSNYHAAFVASYAKGIKHAKNFLIFMASEEGQKIFAKAMNGPTLPFGYNVQDDKDIWSNYSGYAKSRWAIANGATYQYIRSDQPLGAASLPVYRANSNGPLEVLLSHSDKKLRMTAQQIYEMDYKYYKTGTLWEDLLRRAGMLK